jgi:hypothetical protein
LLDDLFDEDTYRRSKEELVLEKTALIAEKTGSGSKPATTGLNPPGQSF